MCSRECYSVSPSSLIAGLLVFLAAFLVGVVTVDSIETIFLPDAQITRIRNNVTPVEIQRQTMKKDFHPLEVTYDCSSTEGNQTVAIFTVTNVGSEPIYFDLTIAGLLTAHFFDATGTTDRDAPANVIAKEIGPGESEKVSALMPPGAKVYEYSFDYSAGTRHVSRHAFGSAGAAFRTCVNSSIQE